MLPITAYWQLLRSMPCPSSTAQTTHRSALSHVIFSRLFSDVESALGRPKCGLTGNHVLKVHLVIMHPAELMESVTLSFVLGLT